MAGHFPASISGKSKSIRMSDPQCFVTFAGLVPISYEHLSKSIHFGYVQISAKSIQELLNSFGEFLNRMSDEEPFCYYMLYMEWVFDSSR